jgi:hypothetical protein
VKNRLIYLFIGLLILTTLHMTLNFIPRELEGGIYIETDGASFTRNSVNVSPSFLPELQEDHTLIPPNITSPTSGETLNGSVTITWTKAIDSLNHTILYTVSYSMDGGKRWFTLKSDISKTSYEWDTSNTDWTDYCIRVEAECSEGLTSEDIVEEVTIQNILTPLIRFFLTVILFAIVLIILIGANLYRKRVSPGEGFPALNDLKTVDIGLCLGSFTDKGLLVKGKNDNCPFSLIQIQSMLEYSAALYQDGKAETMYGPIPLASVNEIELPMEPQTEWNFVSYWITVKDSTVKDSRITKIGGVVPAGLLFFYPKQLDHRVIVKKNKIVSVFKSAIDRDTDISNFTKETLNKIEKQLLKLIIS